MNALWTALIVSFFMISACKSVPKNRGPGYVPAALQCPTDMDPNCIGGSTAAIQVPIAPAAEQRTSAKKTNPFISGRCELIDAGDPKPRSCEGLRLIVRSTRDNEVRVARYNGYGFQIDDLNEGTDYRIEAIGRDQQRYDVKTDSPTLRPGQKTQVRVITVPRL
jgi:hypothetical protein